MQLKRLADAQPPVRRGEVVKQEQLARTQQNALLDRIQIKSPRGEVGSLVCKGFELRSAQEASLTGGRERRRVIGRLDEAGEDALDIASSSFNAVTSVDLSVPTEPLQKKFGPDPGSLAEQSAKRDDASQRSRRAVSIDV